MRCGCAEFRTPRACHVIGPVTIELRDASARWRTPAKSAPRDRARGRGGGAERVVSRPARPYFRPNAAILNTAIRVVP
jgi:hypothetical protein